MIESLIDKQDTFEIVRDKIGYIIASESASQQALATTALKDPLLWKLRTFIERSNPFEEVLSNLNDLTPIVNIWYDNADFSQRGGNVVECQKSDGMFNIDCYGFGISENNVLGGHVPGDYKSAIESHRSVRLVRNIMMSSVYTYLGLRGVVGKRWINSITSFRPQIDESSTVHVLGTRIALYVNYNEFSPQYDGQDLEYLHIEIANRSESGEIIINTDYDYTL